jgi:hypothetical protein
MNTKPHHGRVLIDGNIIDALAVDAPTMGILQRLQAEKAIELLITFVQVTELNNTPVEERRQQLLTTLAALNPRKVTTPGVHDVTNWDEFTWVGEETQAKLNLVMGNKCPTRNKWADALITAAAANNAAAVVTDNYKDVRKAADRFAKGGAEVDVWTYGDFKHRITMPNDC